MRLSVEDVQEFKELWRHERGEELDDARAEVLARRLLRLVRFLVEPQESETNEVR